VEAYGGGLAEKPEIVALSKADAVPKDEMKKKARALKKVAGVIPLIVSAASGEGVLEVLRALAAEVRALRAQDKADAVREKTPARGWRP
jgi:GTP-binding protein